MRTACRIQGPYCQLTPVTAPAQAALKETAILLPQARTLGDIFPNKQHAPNFLDAKPWFVDSRRSVGLNIGAWRLPIASRAQRDEPSRSVSQLAGFFVVVGSVHPQSLRRSVIALLSLSTLAAASAGWRCGFESSRHRQRARSLPPLPSPSTRHGSQQNIVGQPKLSKKAYKKESPFS